MAVIHDLSRPPPKKKTQTHIMRMCVMLSYKRLRKVLLIYDMHHPREVYDRNIKI